MDVARRTPKQSKTSAQRTIPNWAIFAVAILIALVTANVIHVLHDRAERLDDGANELQRVQLMAAQAHQIETTITTAKLDVMLMAGYSAEDNPFLRAFDDLDATIPSKEIDRLRASYLAYQDGLAKLYALTLAGQIGRAEQLRDEIVVPAGETFRGFIDLAVPTAQDRASVATRVEKWGTFASLLLAAVLISLINWRFQRHRVSTMDTYEEKKRLSEEQAVLWKIGELAVSEPDLFVVLPEVARSTMPILNAECIVVEEWHPDDECTEVLTEQTLPDWPGAVDPGERFDLADFPATEWVLRNRDVLSLEADDPRLSARERVSFEEYGTGSQLILPLVIDQTAIGALTLLSRAPLAFGEREIWLGREVAAMIALAVQNARSRASINTHVAEQEALLRLSQETEQRYRTLVEQVPAITYIESLDGARLDNSYLYVSPQVEAVLGYTPEELYADPDNWVKMLHPDDLENAIAEDARTEREQDAFRLEYRVFAKNGDIVWVYDEAVLVRDEAGAPRYWHGIMLDVTAQKDAEAKQLEAEAEFRLLFSQIPHPTWVYDVETLEMLEINDAAVTHYGYTRDQFLSMRVTDLLPSKDQVALRVRTSTDRLASPADGEMRHVTKDGTQIDIEVSSHTLTFRGRPAMLVIAQDITERLALEAKLTHQAFHDTLTELPNRALFNDRLSHALERSAPVAVLFIDLDDFKVTNDTLGHKAGDELLLAVGERLIAGVRPGDTLARLGGDEFTILLESGGLEEATALADSLHVLLSEPFIIDDHEITVLPSIGIALGDPLADRPDEVLRRADVAMYEAKHRGKAQYAIFDRNMDSSAWNRLSLEADLRRAVQNDQLRVYYQPIVALENEQIVELEALVRWQHPERGLVSPADFIPVAEETGLILPIGLWVLEQACRQCAAWHGSYPCDTPLTISVNLSARQFEQPDLADEVKRVLAVTGLPAASLKLEITETVAMKDFTVTVATLNALRDIGVRIAIDDFGIGYSGLSFLQACPVDTLKIDRSFVAGLGIRTGDTALVRAVLAFAKTLNLTITAEGVETEEQVAQLKALECDRGQGYFYSRPQPADGVQELLTRCFLSHVFAA